MVSSDHAKIPYKLPIILQNLTKNTLNAKINQIFTIVALLMEAVKYNP